MLDEMAQRSWLVRMPLGYITLDRESGEHFLRSRSTTFPGRLIAEAYGVDDGPLRREIDHNLLHLDGADRARTRPRRRTADDLRRRDPPLPRDGPGPRRAGGGAAVLAPRMPNLRLAQPPAFDTVQGVYGLDSLHLTWG